VKRIQKILVLAVALSAWTFTGCSSDSGTTPAETVFEMLVELLDQNFGDWITAWNQTAQYVNDNLADLHILDLRSADDFAAGHIDGAVNVDYGTLLDEAANAGTKPVCVVCYSGQTAAYAVMALRMMGYEDAFSMKFGMSAWNTQFMGPWETSIGSTRAGDFVTTTSPALPSYDAPVLTTAGDTGMEILANRVLEVLGEGYMGLTHAEVYDDLESYSIYNYWEEADYTDLGHIDGAYQLDPGTLISDENLLVLDPDGENVIYCWTGQTGSLTACYLNVLGYTVYNLKYGVNAMIYDELPSHVWPTGGYPDWNYDYVTGPLVTEFDILTEYTDTMFEGWTSGWIQGADYVHENMADLFIIDLRSEADFNNGHIENAHNVTLDTMLDDVETNNTDALTVAAVCYSGQTAAFATTALRMAGWDAFSMKFGMCAWNQDFMDPWESNISNDFAAVMINDASPALPENDWPVIVTGLTTAEAILAAQVDAVLAEGFGANGVTNDAVFGDLEGYRIFNYWSQADYEDLGHIPGSYQVDPTSVSATTLTTGENLSAFYPGDPNVLYCWTGQTSAMTTFYLNVMGYDMLSLKFGANGMMYDELPSHIWPTGGYPDWNYPYVTE